MDWKDRLKTAFGDAAPDDDIVEELAQHASDAYHAARAEGHGDAAATTMVEQLIADWATDPAALRRRRSAPSRPPAPLPASSRLAGLINDARYACRVLRRQPGYTATAVLTLALGIGATTLIFSVLYGVLLKPLAWPHADRLVRLSETRRGANRSFGAVFTNASYLAWRDRPSTLDGLAGWSARTVTVSGAGDAARVSVGAVTPTLFPLLEARPALGTLFTERDATVGAEQVVVLSYGFWQERFGGSASAIGKTLTLDGKAHRIVAVMPASFAFPDREARAWVPLVVPPVSDGTTNRRTLAMFAAMGRLRAGVTTAQAAAEGTARAHNGPDLGLVGVAVFGSKAPPDIAVVPLLEADTKDVRPAILVFFVAVGLLLVTATANVASLQLARATSRRREVAIRTALGASISALARQFLVESCLVGLAGGATGVLLAVLLHRTLPALLPAGFPRVDEITIGAPVLALAIVVSLACGAIFGVLPALDARRMRLIEPLTEDGLAPVGGGRGRTRTARTRAFIIAGQVAVASLLLVGALLLGRSLLALLDVDRGYDRQNLLTASLPMPDGLYDGHRRADMAARLLARVRAMPAVSAAAVTATLPLTSGEILGGFTMPARDGSGITQVHAAFRSVSPGYFEAMRIHLLGGRFFTDTDSGTSQPVVIVNRTFARQYLREPAVGQQLEPGIVIGVVDDVRAGAVSDATQPEIYACYLQDKNGLAADEPKIAVRTAGSPTSLVPTLRQLVRELDHRVPLDDISTMEDRLSAKLAQPRLYAVLLGGFAVLALMIAAVGLFGVVSYSVAQRTREIGVRTALGAAPLDILALVVRQGVVVTAVGIAGGLGVALGTLKYASTLLHGVQVYDPWSYALVAGIVMLIAVLACGLPARRAARIDPVRALRT